MPTIIDRATGNVIQEIDYGPNQQAEVDAALEVNPNATVVNNAMNRSTVTYDDGTTGNNNSEVNNNPYEEITKGY